MCSACFVQLQLLPSITPYCIVIISLSPQILHIVITAFASSRSCQLLMTNPVYVYPFSHALWMLQQNLSLLLHHWFSSPFNIFVQHLILLSVIQQNHSLRSQEQRTWLPIYEALTVRWILLVSTKGKEWRRVWRKWILMLGCKGLMNWRGISIMVKFHNINEKQSSYFLLFVVWSLVFLNSACLLFAFSISCLLFSTLSVLS